MLSKEMQPFLSLYLSPSLSLSLYLSLSLSLFVSLYSFLSKPNLARKMNYRFLNLSSAPNFIKHKSDNTNIGDTLPITWTNSVKRHLSSAKKVVESNHNELYSRISISRNRISRILRNFEASIWIKNTFWLLSPTIIWRWRLFYKSKLPEVKINLHFG